LEKEEIKKKKEKRRKFENGLDTWQPSYGRTLTVGAPRAFTEGHPT